MKNMKVLLVAIAVMSLPIAFAQKAFCQNAPEIDSVEYNRITQGDSGTITFYGSNLLNSNGSVPTTFYYWSDICADATPVDSYGTCNIPGAGYSNLVSFNSVVSYALDGTSITVSYTSSVIPISCGYGYCVGDDLGSAIVVTDGGSAYSPDIAIDNPNL